MEWYWWVILAIVLIGFAYLKVKIGGAWLQKQKENREKREKQLEDD